jgi:hypothetical protein
MSDLERLADLDRDLEAAISPDLLGQFALLGGEEDTILSPDEKRRMDLADLQVRHAAELHDEGTLWKAYQEATNYDIRQPDRVPLPVGIPYRACVYRVRGTRSGREIQVSGVRFVTSDFVDGEVRETNYDVPVVVNGQPRVGFGSMDIETMDRLVGELEDRRQELRLRHDLSGVLIPRRSTGPQTESPE